MELLFACLGFAVAGQLAATAAGASGGFLLSCHQFYTKQLYLNHYPILKYFLFLLYSIPIFASSGEFKFVTSIRINLRKSIGHIKALRGIGLGLSCVHRTTIVETIRQFF
ncbi:hypothetical protein [Methylovulum sp.]|uniref:hypothetical protein n=1 Tax=Methylovulum sp. TaxID=1916980 RepID=UPI00263569A7|nr:hypothetical protein [Methylovulum sp.]MDD5125393.1 hypothetical protein [Methylovulum sp.]